MRLIPMYRVVSLVSSVGTADDIYRAYIRDNYYHGNDALTLSSVHHHAMILPL